MSGNRAASHLVEPSPIDPSQFMSRVRSAPKSGASKPAKPAKQSKAVKTTARKPVAGKAIEPALQLDDDDTLMSFLRGMITRDQEALSRLYDATASRLYGVALRIVRQAELAEEVVSDTYFQAWRDCGRYDATRGKVLAWLLIICRSRALDALRRRDEALSHPDPHELSGEPSDPRENPQDLLSAVQESTVLHAALLTLSPLQRQLVALAFFRGLSHSEIEEHTGIPLGSVKTHIRKALSVLRGALGDAAGGIAAQKVEPPRKRTPSREREV
jgi:RNA polymerase sigma factor (sigma-70 family)